MDKTFNAVRQFAESIGLKKSALAPRPPRGMEPREMDLHDVDYHFPKLTNKTREKTLLPVQDHSQLSAKSSTMERKIDSSPSPSSSKPSYLSVNSASTSPDTTQIGNSMKTDRITEHLAAEKPTIASHQAKEAKECRGIIAHKIRAVKIGTELPVGHEQLKTAHAWTMSATTITMPDKFMSQPGVATLLNQNEAKALPPQFYGRNQLARDAAQGNLNNVSLFIAAYPEADVGPGEYSPSPLMEAARNGHIDVVKALVPRASEKVQLDALCEVFRIATSTEKRQALAPVIHALAQEFKDRDKNDSLNTITENLTGEHFDWVFDTLIKEWT